MMVVNWEYEDNTNHIKLCSLELTPSECLLILKGLTLVEQNEYFHEFYRKSAEKMHTQIIKGLKGGAE